MLECIKLAHLLEEPFAVYVDTPNPNLAEGHVTPYKADITTLQQLLCKLHMGWVLGLDTCSRHLYKDHSRAIFGLAESCESYHGSLPVGSQES